ncbi:hypothetical protein ACWWAH_08515 [Xylella fastidiosa subsp. pauca]
MNQASGRLPTSNTRLNASVPRQTKHLRYIHGLNKITPSAA